MRKTIIGIYALAAMLTACSNDETLDVVAKIPITFGNVFVEKSTRAAVDNTYGGGTADINKLTKFNVYGTVASNGNTVNIYMGDEVTGEIGTDIWTCANTQYWINGCDYKFIALVDADVTETNKDQYGMPMNFTYNVKTQKDLLLATQTVEKDHEKFGQTIDFNFSHLLSKAVFTFTNNFAAESGVHLTVQDIKITNAPQTGTYQIASGSWNILSDNNTDEVSFGYSEPINPGGERGQSSKVQLLLPGTYTFQISFTVVHDKGGEPTIKTMTTTEFEIKAGHSYNFTAELNQNNVEGVLPITFTITEDDNWDSDDDIDVNY